MTRNYLEELDQVRNGDDGLSIFPLAQEMAEELTLHAIEPPDSWTRALTQVAFFLSDMGTKDELKAFLLRLLKHKRRPLDATNSNEAAIVALRAKVKNQRRELRRLNAHNRALTECIANMLRYDDVQRSKKTS